MEAIMEKAKPLPSETTEIEQQNPERGRGPCHLSMTTCDETLLFLLPCLHTACKPCIDQTAQERSSVLNCPCGQAFDLEKISPDHVRMNEAAYVASNVGEKKCGFLSGDHDDPAKVYCHDCHGYLCSKCFTLHNTIRCNSKHRIRNMNSTEDRPIKNWLGESFCTDHSDTEVQLYDHSCRKPICVVCLYGAHKNHRKDDLKCLYDETRTMLGDHLEKQKLKLKDIKDKLKTVTSDCNMLTETRDKREAEALSVYESVAERLQRRHTHLLQEITENLKDPLSTLQEKTIQLQSAEASLESTIDYTERALRSSRQEELIALSDTLQWKMGENLKSSEISYGGIPPPDFQLYFQGKKALEELIDTFGTQVTCLADTSLTDAQATIGVLQMERNMQSEEITELRGMLEAKDELISSQKQRWNKVKTIVAPDRIYSIGSTNFRLFICPALYLNDARTNTNKCHVTKGAELVNSPRASGHGRRLRLNKFNGICISTPFPIPPKQTPFQSITQYWETCSNVGVGRGVWSKPILEMGLAESGKVDSESWLCHQLRSWCVGVRSCDRHRGKICTRVHKEWEDGNCWVRTMSDTTGNQATLHYGIVLDVNRKRLAFIDLDREVVLAKFDVEFREALFPVLSVLPESDFYSVRMKLVSGEDITMTEKKKSLIYQALL
ncbi:uncharacterized protein LOC124112456 [Haliotis rufescens]|uniref:uncharacterized protein LOC124112456 n=1 Tax=Haliotis rufescens TaxID=6454 RepID=UPI001EB08B35|nr:uncharacterized protein LOC124112456 [Haliotis rufescens]